MNGRAYYNEIDPYAAQWLRNLIGADLIAAASVLRAPQHSEVFMTHPYAALREE